jgi:hypothetical protein
LPVTTTTQAISSGQNAHHALDHQWRQTRTPVQPIIAAKAQCMLGTAA